MLISDRTTARIVGWLFIGTLVFSIPGYLLYGPLLDHPDYVLGSGHDMQITLGAFLEILTAICNIGTAVALYPLARRYSHRVALGYVATRIVESTIIVAGIVSVLSVLTVRQQFAGTGADADTLTSPGRRSSPSTTGRSSSAPASAPASATVSCSAISCTRQACSPARGDPRARRGIARLPCRDRSAVRRLRPPVAAADPPHRPGDDLGDHVRHLSGRQGIHVVGHATGPRAAARAGSAPGTRLIAKRGATTNGLSPVPGDGAQGGPIGCHSWMPFPSGSRSAAKRPIG